MRKRQSETNLHEIKGNLFLITLGLSFVIMGKHESNSKKKIDVTGLFRSRKRFINLELMPI